MDNDVFEDFLSDDDEFSESDDQEKLIMTYLEDKGISAMEAIEVVGNDIDSYIDLVNIFVDVSSDRMQEMKEYLADGDMSNYSVLAHSTKSDSILVGAENLSVLAKSHELESKKNNIDFAKDNWDALIEEWEDVLAKFNDFLDAING